MRMLLCGPRSMAVLDMVGGGGFPFSWVSWFLIMKILIQSHCVLVYVKLFLPLLFSSPSYISRELGLMHIFFPSKLSKLFVSTVRYDPWETRK